MSERIAQIERLDEQGQVLQVWDVAAWPLRLGRGFDQELSWPDAHLAEHHLTLALNDEGQLTLAPRSSLNGVQLEGRTLTAAAVLPIGAVWQAGGSHWRVRQRGEPAAAEVPLGAGGMAFASNAHRGAPPPPTSLRGLFLLAAAALGWEASTLWLDQTPSSTWNAYLTPLVGAVGAIIVWALLWGLASKLFTHRYTVAPHLRIALMYLLATFVIEALAGVVAYALDWPALARWAGPVTLVVGAAMLAHHLRVVLPQQAQRVNVAVAGMTVAGLALAGALSWQRQERLIPYVHLSTLPPPALRLAQPQPVAVLVDELRTLEGPLQDSARRAKDEEDGSPDEAD